jgi:AcrR family transcriptional regulator
MTDPARKRRYHSPSREHGARATRGRIREAAAERFVRHGYARTSMSAVARDAGVSERTVFLVFPTKAALLAECVRVAVRGGDGAVPLAAHEDSQAILDAAPELMLTRLAERSAALFARAGRLLAVGESAPADDPALVAVREHGRAATRADLLETAGALQRAGVLRPGLSAERAAEAMYALVADEQVYLRLVEHCGRPESEYVALMARALAGALAAP